MVRLAEDATGILSDARDCTETSKGKDYVCPFCGGILRFRKGGWCTRDEIKYYRESHYFHKHETDAQSCNSIGFVSSKSNEGDLHKRSKEEFFRIANNVCKNEFKFLQPIKEAAFLDRRRVVDTAIVNSKTEKMIVSSEVQTSRTSPDRIQRKAYIDRMLGAGGLFYGASLEIGSQNISIISNYSDHTTRIDKHLLEKTIYGGYHPITGIYYEEEREKEYQILFTDFKTMKYETYDSIARFIESSIKQSEKLSKNETVISIGDYPVISRSERIDLEREWALDDDVSEKYEKCLANLDMSEINEQRIICYHPGTQSFGMILSCGNDSLFADVVFVGKKMSEPQKISKQDLFVNQADWDFLVMKTRNKNTGCHESTALNSTNYLPGFPQIEWFKVRDIKVGDRVNVDNVIAISSTPSEDEEEASLSTLLLTENQQKVILPQDLWHLKIMPKSVDDDVCPKCGNSVIPGLDASHCPRCSNYLLHDVKLRKPGWLLHLTATQ